MPEKPYGCAVALITAVQIETSGVLRLYEGWEELAYADDEQRYYTASFARDGCRYRVVTAQQNGMGMTAATSLSHKLIERFRPRYLIMTGIAAGIGAEHFYGDVIIPDVIWDYSAGKFVSADQAQIRMGDLGFLPRPARLCLRPELIPVLHGAIADPANECHVHIGPMACGSAVVSSSIIVDKQVRSQIPQTIGLDMESYGVFYACRHAIAPQPEPIVIKSVCDYANEEKSDLYQKFAAHTSSEFAKLLYERHLPLDEVAEL